MPAARAVRVQILERHVAVNRHRGLHYTDFSGQDDPPIDDVPLFGGARLESSLRSYNELLYSHYSFTLHVILHVSYSLICIFYLILLIFKRSNVPVAYPKYLSSICGRHCPPPRFGGLSIVDEKTRREIT